MVTVGAEEMEPARGALLGLAVGDALGAPWEGCSPRAARAAVAAGLDMTGGKGWAPGEWTDDTAMALTLAESIVERGLLDVDDVGRRYIAWAATRPRDMGRATRHALVGARDAGEARARALALYERGLPAAGNGTVMRASPIGLATRDRGRAAAAARRDARLTHGDPRAHEASAALCAALVALAEGDDALTAAAAECDPAGPVGRALRLAAEDASAELARLAAGPEGGACWTALGIAFRALLHAPSFEEGVSFAVSLGGDTDTNAAVAGCLLGAREGARAIPDRWLAKLQERPRIEGAAAGLARLRLASRPGAHPGGRPGPAG